MYIDIVDVEEVFGFKKTVSSKKNNTIHFQNFLIFYFLQPQGVELFRFGLVQYFRWVDGTFSKMICIGNN